MLSKCDATAGQNSSCQSYFSPFSFAAPWFWGPFHTLRISNRNFLFQSLGLSPLLPHPYTIDVNDFFVNDYRYYYYLLTVSTITIVFVCAVVALYYVHLLLPIVVMIGSFIMFVLWITGLVKASIELWGPLGSINDNCVRYVYNDDFWGDGSLYTLARIQQQGVCNLWQTTFALEMIAT